ncbi:hypothetical protein CPB84DRAFT_1746455 [Gymnopilus junonius]|uniref:Uncharacterized protein n=1 Tax=Gymnopilus junonius TaxID=109634 RepID=A0A9P5NRM8_GYMJU|nr:hypothetical protein CPB84DRAFT_1746455 [Gymnopilus junonius]
MWHHHEQALEMLNRYFTPRKQAQEAEEFTLGCDIDPKDILKKATGNHLVHIEDNIVQYYEMVKRFIPAKLIKFQVGDIVEAQVSIILIPQCESKFKSTMVLQSLTIMDGTFTQDAAKMQLQLQKSAIANISMGPTLKCSVGYADEEFGITKHKFSRLRVDEDEDDVNKANEEWD